MIDSLHFLIVEDEPFQRDALAMLLTNIGARHIQQAENGRVALDLLQELETRADSTPVDIALCDLDMPEMDGMALLRNLAGLKDKPNVILVSGMDTAMRDSVAIMARAYDLRLLGVMPKPPSRSKLLALLDQHDPVRHKKSQQSSRLAISRDEIAGGLKNGEFVPYFQPKVDMASGRVVGVEALARWNSPAHGLLAPGAFLAAVEEHGLMDSLTWIILAQSATIGLRWHEQGLPLLVSVNLSLSSLGRVELAERIFEVVTSRGMKPSSMILEVTESAAMSVIGPSLENLARLRLRGFGLSIDDYGTGYSSLQQLTRVPFTELKIDQSFVREAAHQETTRSVVESSLDIARKLGLKTTAEGIETPEHWDMLSTMGCDIAQGYLIAKPMPAGAIPDWVANWKLSSIHAAAPALQAVDILLVEDEAFQRETYVELLEQLQLGNVDAAQDVDQALQCLAGADYGMVITDIDLGGVSGLDLVRRIRAGQTAAAPQTRIVLLSSHTEQDVVFQSIALDINGFLTKPAKANTLRDAIQHALAEPFTAQAPAAYLEKGTAEESPMSHVSASIMRPGEASAPEHGFQSEGEQLSVFAMKPGMVLAAPIYTHQQIKVLGRGQVLTRSVINRLLDIYGSLASPDVRVFPAVPGQVATEPEISP